MTRPSLEVISEDAGLYAIAREAGETLGVIGPMDDYDAILAAAVERWPTVSHIDLPDPGSNATHKLRIYRAQSGQWSGTVYEDGEDVAGIAGCDSPEEVEDAAREQFPGLEVEPEEPCFLGDDYGPSDDLPTRITLR